MPVRRAAWKARVLPILATDCGWRLCGPCPRCGEHLLASPSSSKAELQLRHCLRCFLWVIEVPEEVIALPAEAACEKGPDSL